MFREFNLKTETSRCKYLSLLLLERQFLCINFLQCYFETVLVNVYETMYMMVFITFLTLLFFVGVGCVHKD